MKQVKKVVFVFWNFLKWAFLRDQDNESRAETTATRSVYIYSAEKQQEIETLCNRLFRQKSLITSGKLQLIGLAKIKRRMGRAWERLQPLIYQIVEEAIARHMATEDVFVRYQEDKYVIIFGSASLEEGELKALVIAEEIKSNIFALNKEELKGFGVEKNVHEVETAALIGKPLHETVEKIAHAQAPSRKTEVYSHYTPVTLKSIEVGADYAIETAPVIVEENQWKPVKRLDCSYAPLWDMQKNALTTYLCRAPKVPLEKRALSSEAHDMAMLETVIVELRRMSEEEQKFFIVCPVRHDTLYRNSDYKKFTALCQHMTEEQRKFLILMIVDPLENLSRNTAYWFVSPLKGHCSAVFVEVPVQKKTDFFYFYQSGFDAMGFSLKKRGANETTKIETMNAFGAQAKTAMMSGTFVLDVSTLSLATSAACAGFRYLGGTAIHEDVPVPDKMYRYKHEDLLSGLASQ